MKNTLDIIILIVSFGFLASCELDNFDGPNAELNGSIIDEATGELVQQDIIRGCIVELRERGYDPVSPQALIIKNDGTYRNSMLFAATYRVELLRTNFHPLDTIDVKVDGVTTQDFMVTPYIRLNDVNVTKTGNMVTATFSLEQTTASNVKKIGLYISPDPMVGEPMRIADVQQDINAVVDPSDVFTLEIDVTSDPDLKAGTEYFFRVGALIDEPDSRFNYAPAVSMTL